MSSYCKHKTQTCFQNWWACTLLLCYHPVQALLERGVPSFSDALTRATIKPHFSPHDQTYFCMALFEFWSFLLHVPLANWTIFSPYLQTTWLQVWYNQLRCDLSTFSSQLLLHNATFIFCEDCIFPWKLCVFGWRRNMKILEV